MIHWLHQTDVKHHMWDVKCPKQQMLLISVHLFHHDFIPSVPRLKLSKQMRNTVHELKVELMNQLSLCNIYFFTLKNTGMFQPTLGQIWTNPTFGLKIECKNLTQQLG